MTFPPRVRRRPPAVVCAGLTAVALTASLTACTGGSPAPLRDRAAAPTTSERTFPPVAGSELPVDATPDTTGDRTATCPYLDGPFVETTTGQRWTGTSLDPRFDPPACVFWSYEDVPQLTVMVRRMTTHRGAVDVVDTAAPVDSTQKALRPDGWSGGRGGDEASAGTGGGAAGSTGAVYAVWKDNLAVVVTASQEQSVKAERIAERVIADLGL
ncbi:DUF2020 domain-containing protein [Corynebacterium bovis]|uniref:UPF0176 protein n=1 Tax=Corynebacterium bovis DSM 20582 = CIP 54.80 TaxID=927655 RepID=A0A8H9Y9J5_9CORY|nr:DUF2020 domain-containing protein [Corynebacterium bovis]MBB3115838.1 UPF0176 protein [Corynebacterium bovis DSM 20582 = CIP 54.80]MDK8511629.1 DUF2020 domain-containing protein [Corynebacterium bovis]QQC46803.1 DUF2020 domain-containing protein [Corynebacterium bovis]RRO81064.1 DUF2020 domain-containing protein [Corynebacterium bovis]RRO83401.1 DUF2020 domain-containing protein [Corynebacterium bovis]